MTGCIDESSGLRSSEDALASAASKPGKAASVLLPFEDGMFFSSIGGRLEGNEPVDERRVGTQVVGVAECFFKLGLRRLGDASLSNVFADRRRV